MSEDRQKSFILLANVEHTSNYPKNSMNLPNLDDLGCVPYALGECKFFDDLWATNYMILHIKIQNFELVYFSSIGDSFAMGSSLARGIKLFWRSLSIEWNDFLYKNCRLLHAGTKIPHVTSNFSHMRTIMFQNNNI